MNNFIAYFYNIDADKITYTGKYYMFYFNNYLYHLYILDDNIDVNKLIQINKNLPPYAPVSEIVINKDGNCISTYNKTNYTLIKIYDHSNKIISLDVINNLANLAYSQNKHINWGLLWCRKVDYLEKLINENGKKYPLLVDSFNYFVGMAENAISYYNSIVMINPPTCFISHKTIRYNDGIEELYNPLNIIFDYRARDIAEYIKVSFFNNNENIYTELTNFLNKNILSTLDASLIVARMMYPSFYFDLYEDILLYNQSELIIAPFVDRLPEYEKYLANIINLFKNKYHIPVISWLTKKEDVTLH